MARNEQYGPGYYNLDLSLSKSVRFREGWNGAFRAEAFNALNHVNFAEPSTTDVDTAAAGSLGKITGQQGNNRIMQLSFRLQF